jgi:RNA polymerase sigma-70 factor, ECF subfamily
MNSSLRIRKLAESTAEERQLVCGVLEKDRKATAEFVARYSDALYSYVRRRMVPRVDLVEDIVQEVFLAAWKDLGRFRGESLRAWLLGIARHKVEDHYRKRLRDLEVPSEGYESSVIPMLEERIDGVKREQSIERTLMKMPEPYTIVLLWRYLENRSVREMAEASGKTEKAIERMLARARQDFRRRWTDVTP